MFQMMTNMNIRTYDELIKLETFEERLLYLKIYGQVAEETFGSNRWINQQFYKSDIWLRIKDKVIARDLGLDLGVTGYDIFGPITVHHMNPITERDIIELTDYAINPKYLISCSDLTHKVIHYGDPQILIRDRNPIIRRPNDTCPWKR